MQTEPTFLVKRDQNDVWHYWLEQGDDVIQFELSSDDFREKRTAEVALLEGKPCDLPWVILQADGDLRYLIANGAGFKDFRLDREMFNRLRFAENQCLRDGNGHSSQNVLLSAIL